MERIRGWLSVVVLLVGMCCLCTAKRHLREVKGADTYTEELSVKRLPTAQILFQFRFVVTTPKWGDDYGTYPRIIAEVIRKYSLRELHFSLVQGFWRTSEWGIPPQPSAPTGAQLYAWMDPSNESVDLRWDRLVNSLNGIFCTSLLDVVPDLSSSPRHSYLPRGLYANDTVLRYGALSGESVCTENLTPWKKLLPCKQTGLSTLLNPVKLYEAVYHSMSMHALQVCEGKGEKCEVRQRLELNLNFISEIDLFSRSLDWSLSTIFGRKVDEKCEIADLSNIIVEKDLPALTLSANSAAQPSEVLKLGERTYYVYSINMLPKESFPLNIMARYSAKLTLPAKASDALLSIDTIQSGTGQQSGRVVSWIANRQGMSQTVIYTHMIPWFMRVYFRSITLHCEHSATGIELKSRVNSRSFVPAKDRQRPLLMEWNITLPPESICDLSFDFDRAFMRVSEFPPDANHGKYVPAASLTFVANDRFWRDNRTALGGHRATALEELSGEEVSRTVTIHSEALLVILPVPDFSMPFNVICLVCTALAMLFGPVHSLTTKTMIPISEKNKHLAPKPPIRALIAGIRWLILKLRDFLRRKIRGELPVEKEDSGEPSEKPDSGAPDSGTVGPSDSGTVKLETAQDVDEAKTEGTSVGSDEVPEDAVKIEGTVTKRTRHPRRVD